MRVLWVGDALIQSGFSVVTHGVCNELQDMCDVTVFGIGYDGRTRNNNKYYVFPGVDGANIYSCKRAAEVANEEKFDSIVLFNDLPVIVDYAREIRKLLLKVPLISLVPLNTPVPRKEIIELTNYDFFEALTYTDFSKRYIESINPNLVVRSVYHGVDRAVFFRDNECKQKSGLSKYFVVGYIGSNSYRKRLDLLLEGFSKFAKNKDDVRCVLHVNNVNLAYPIESIAGEFGIKDKIIISSNLPSDRMRLVYSIFDVNINTSLGEGFCLPLLEGAACGVPILCPEHGNLVDIWSSGADFVKIARTEYIPNTTTRGSVIDTDDMVTKLGRLYEDRNYLKQLGADAYRRSNDSLFSWKVVSGKVYDSIVLSTKSRLNIMI